MAFDRAIQYQYSRRQDAKQQANHALATSRAIIETLVAEKRVSSSLLREAEIYACSVNEMAQATDDRVALATQQLHNLLQQTRSSGFSVEILASNIQPRPRPPPPHPSNAANNPTADDLDFASSDSDFSEQIDELQDPLIRCESGSSQSHSNDERSDISIVYERDSDPRSLPPETSEGDMSDSQSFYDVETRCLLGFDINSAQV